MRELKNAANYFLTLGELPQTVADAASTPHSISSGSKKTDKQQLEDLVLSIIAENTAESSGIGRVSILNELKASNIHLSDDKLRKLLRDLEDSGKITVGRGRTGCMIV